MLPSRGLCWAVLALLALQSAAAFDPFSFQWPTMSSDAAQLSPSVLIQGEWDWKLVLGTGVNFTKVTSRCLDMVQSARQLTTGNKLSFVPTFNWLPKVDGLGVSEFCYWPMGNTTQAGDKLQCLLWGAQKLIEFKEGMKACFLEAFKQGFVPYMTPQLADGWSKGIWPGTLLFSPLQKYGAFSYAEVVTTPLAEAMRDALAQAEQLGVLVTPPDATRPVVFMGLQGEMSATLMRYTTDWQQLIPLIKNTIGTKWADVKVGAGLSFNALDAVETTASTWGSTFLDALFAGTVKAPVNGSAPPIQVDQLKQLFADKLDFLGISAYSPFSGSNFQTTEFENAANSVAASLASLAGIDLASLVSSGKLELFYNHFGIGGGSDWMAPFNEAVEACAVQPWNGVVGQYSSLLDPWKNSLLGAFRESFFGKALTWLGAPNSGALSVKEVFVWGMSSWDVFGIYPDSTSPTGTFRDLTIVKQIAHYNAAIMATQLCQFGRTDPCVAFLKANEACLIDDSGAACLGDVKTSTPPTTESDPAQPSTGTTDTPVETSSPPASTPAQEQDESGPAQGGIQMGPGSASAASPAPTAVVTTPSPVEVIAVKPATTATTSTKSSAASRQLTWVFSMLLPLLFAGALLA